MDLEEIGEFIAQDNPLRAETFLAQLENHCRSLIQMPNAYPARPGLRPGIRVSVHGKYLIFFKLEGGELQIVRILHGARNLSNLLNL